MMSSSSWAASDRPLVFAHRGGSRLAPENTLAAFDRAVAEGVDGLELDVRLSRDGEVVVCHDARLERTCDATGAIADLMTWELGQVDAGYRFTPGDGTHPFRGCGFSVPLLRDVVRRYPGTLLIVELKVDTPAMAKAAVEVIREERARDRVCFGSFYTDVLQQVRRLEPSSTTSGGRSEVFMAVMAARLGFLPPFRRYRALQVPVSRENTLVVTPGLLRGARRAGVPVQVWIVDRPKDIRRLLAMGVSGIITDRPDVAVRVVADFAAGPPPDRSRRAPSADARVGPVTGATSPAPGTRS